MGYKTLNAFPLRDLWPSSWGARGTLVVGLTHDLVSSEDGKTFPRTDNLGTGSLASLGFHWESEITVTSGRATAAAIEGLLVTNRQVLPPHFTPYLVYIYDAKGVLRYQLTPRGFHLRDSMDDVFTWLAWVAANQFREKRLAGQFLGDYDRVQALIDDVLPAPLASDLEAGLAFADVPPVDPSRPTFVSTNSPLLGLPVVAVGQALLDGGVATVEEEAVGVEAVIQLTSASPNVTGNLYCDPSEITAGISFVVRSTNFGDVGLFNWTIL